MFKLRLLIAGVLLCASAGSASGNPGLFDPSDRAGHWEAGIQTRYTASHDFTGDRGSRLSLEDDLGWGFNAGYNFNEMFNVGFFVAWRSIEYRAHVVAPSLAEPFNFGGWMDTANIGVNATVNVLKRRFTPYVTGGVGWALVDTNIPAMPDIDCFWDPFWGYVCLQSGQNIGKDAASYALGAGLSLQLTEQFFIRAGYEHSWFDIDGANNFDMIRLDLGFLYH